MRSSERVRRLLTGVLRGVHGWSGRALDALQTEPASEVRAPPPRVELRKDAPHGPLPPALLGHEDLLGGPPAHWLEKVRRGAPGLLFAMDARHVAPRRRGLRAAEPRRDAQRSHPSLAEETWPARVTRSEHEPPRAEPTRGELGWRKLGEQREPSNARSLRVDPPMIAPSAQEHPARVERAHVRLDAALDSAPVSRTEQQGARTSVGAPLSTGGQRAAVPAPHQPEPGLASEPAAPARVEYAPPAPAAAPTAPRATQASPCRDEPPQTRAFVAAQGEPPAPPALRSAPALAVPPPAQPYSVSSPQLRAAQPTDLTRSQVLAPAPTHAMPLRQRAASAQSARDASDPMLLRQRAASAQPARDASEHARGADQDLASRWAPLPSASDTSTDELRRRRLAYELARAARLAEEQRRL